MAGLDDGLSRLFQCYDWLVANFLGPFTSNTLTKKALHAYHDTFGSWDLRTGRVEENLPMSFWLHLM